MTMLRMSDAVCQHTTTSQAGVGGGEVVTKTTKRKSMTAVGMTGKMVLAPAKRRGRNDDSNALCFA